jgi:integrase
MASTPRDRIDTLRARIKDGNDIAEPDRQHLLQFSDRMDLLAQTYSDHRHEKLLRHCTIMAEELDDSRLTDALQDRDAAEQIVAWINRRYTNEETNRDYRSALRVFAKRVAGGDDDECPDSIDWVPTSTSSDYDPTPDPRDMLTWEDHIEPMLDEAKYARDAAMIALQFDAGLRGGEFKNLRVGDIQDHDHGLQVTVDGKQGRRTILLIPSVPYVSQWLNNHPDRSNDDHPLWSKLHSPDTISDRMVGKVFKQTADRADVSKPVTLTNFRKSSAAFLASRNLNQAHIEDHHGWVRGSKAAARYISVFGEDSDRELARLHGKDVSDEEPKKIGPVECPRCGRETPRDKDFCVWCEQAIDPGAVEQLKLDERKVQRVILGFARNDPSLLEDVEDREELLTVLQDNPEAQQRAEEFLDELGIS